MISTEPADAVERRPIADAVLKASALMWFLVALAGQWLFAYYIAIFYGGNALEGDWQAWTDRMIVGFREGEPIGNAAVVLHIALAFSVTLLGPLQFVPQIRKHAIGFHRWNGRVYAASGIIISLGALYMVWTRGALDGNVGGLNAVGISMNAALIVTFAVLTVRYAMARRIDVHHGWALRFFIAMSAVWLMRVGYGFWFFLHRDGRPPGVSPNLDGWFDVALPFVVTFVPLLVLELYLRAKDSRSAPAKIATAVLVTGLTVMMGIGVLRFAAMRWLPSI